MSRICDFLVYEYFYIYRELARFIAAGRLHCKIDKVKGIVETNRPDSKNWQYQVINIVLMFPGKKYSPHVSR